jgi:hypothetical protein
LWELRASGPEANNAPVEELERLTDSMRCWRYAWAMDLSNLRAITNNYQDVRLVSLRKWKHAHEIEPRDQGGPYVVLQEGYDSQEIAPSGDEFLLGKSGVWLPVGLFHKMPTEERRKEFVFGRAVEVVELLEGLVGKVKIVRKGTELAETPLEGDDLAAAFHEAHQREQPEQQEDGTA